MEFANDEHARGRIHEAALSMARHLLREYGNKPAPANARRHAEKLCERFPSLRKSLDLVIAPRAAMARARMEQLVKTF